MSGWMIVVIIAIVMSSLVKIFTGRHPHGPHVQQNPQGRNAELTADEGNASRREIAELRERIRVLERIATESNTVTARESRRVAEEIEALRDERQS